MASRKRPDGEATFYTEHFTRGEVADLERALGESMRGEIGQWAGGSGTNWVDAPWDKHRLPLCFIERVRLDCLTGNVGINE